MKLVEFWFGCLSDLLFLRQSHPQLAVASLFPYSSCVETAPQHLLFPADSAVTSHHSHQQSVLGPISGPLCC